MLSFREIKELDTISFNKPFQEVIDDFKEIVNDDEINIQAYFPLDRGVIKLEVNFTGEPSYLYYVFDDAEQTVDVYLYTKNLYLLQNMIKYKVNSCDNSGLNCDVIYVDEGLDVDVIKDYTLKNFEIALGMIIYYKDNPKITYRKQRKSRNTTKNNKVKDSALPTKSKTSVKLGEKVVYEVNSSDEIIKHFKKRQRHTDSWTVMAFLRRLKSGKTTMVKSHVRGNGERNKKEYIIK